MGYKNAKDILPQPLLAMVQQYAAGECLYIPQTAKHPRTPNPQTAQRDEEICRRYMSGSSVRQLAGEYYLAPQSIYKILAKQRSTSVFERNSCFPSPAPCDMLVAQTDERRPHMARIIKEISEPYKTPALDLIEEAFTDWRDETEGKMVRRFVEEIRSKRYYLPQLELICTDETGEIIGYAMFSRFHLEGKFEDELLMLTPVCVKPAFQRQHISRDMLEYGFAHAKAMGFKAVIVEGNPANYRSRGFMTAAEHGVMPGKTVHLPHIDCLMVKELTEGALKTIQGVVEYDFYDTLMEE